MEIDDSRTYKTVEAAAVLDCKPSWLRDQVTARSVPHHRRGKVKGVYFTADDLRQIVDSQRRPARPPIPVSEQAGPEHDSARIELPSRFAGLRSARA